MLALKHIRDVKYSHDSHSGSACAPIIVMVVGAGRGPLVQATLSASSTTEIPVKVYAVEKNANAVITLRNRRITECWSNVGELRPALCIDQTMLI